MEKALTATTVSKVYAHIIANPGATSREIRKAMNIPGHINVTSRVYQLIARGAVVAMPGDSPRNTKYFKGSAPVKLNQPRGSVQNKKQLSAVVKQKQQLVRDIQLLLAQIEALDA